jgi:hypothetical protein
LLSSCSPFDLHASSTPPAFVLSQDQTLQVKLFKPPAEPSEDVPEDGRIVNTPSILPPKGQDTWPSTWCHPGTRTQKLARFVALKRGTLHCLPVKEPRSRPEIQKYGSLRATGSRRARRPEIRKPLDQRAVVSLACALWERNLSGALDPLAFLAQKYLKPPLLSTFIFGKSSFLSRPFSSQPAPGRQVPQAQPGLPV